MEICPGEAARCQRIASQPNFFILIDNRYGCRALPEVIDDAEF